METKQWLQAGPRAGNPPPTQVRVLCRGHPGTRQGLSAPALASVHSERGTREASLIKKETGLGRNVTARLRPAAGKGAPWTPPGTPLMFPLVQLAPPEGGGDVNGGAGVGQAAEAGAKEEASATPWGRRAGVLGLRLMICKDLEKEMATHSSILAWRIPWTEEPGRLQSMG